MSYSDNPIRNWWEESLRRESSVETLKELLADIPLEETPLVVGVYGGWGTGKTSVMNLLLEGIRKQRGERALCLWFEAWKFARQEMALWRALLLAMVQALGDEEKGLPPLLPEDERKVLRDELDELATSLYRSQTITEQGDLKLNWKAAIPFAVDTALSLATFGLSDRLQLSEIVGKLKDDDARAKASEAMSLIEREQATRHREQVNSLEQFHDELRTLTRTHIVPDRRLYVFIDDLDRCLPEDAVGALEALKLFLDLEGCVFVLGMDRSVVEQGIRVRYKEFELAGGLSGPVDPGQYLDKIIQVPFRLPPLDDALMKKFIEIWCRDNQGDKEKGTFCAELEHVAACADLIAKGVAANPRSVKRTVSVLRLMLQLKGGAGQNYTPWGTEDDRKRLAKVVVLQTSYEDVYRQVVERPGLLLEIEKQLETGPRGENTVDWFAERPRLRTLFEERPRFAGLNEDQLRALVYAEVTA